MGGELPPVPMWRRDLRDAPGLDPTARLVGHVLSTYMDGAGRACVSRSTLAVGCGMADVGAVRRAILRLESAGLLGVDRIRGGRYGANRYQAHPNGGWSAPVEVAYGGWSAPVEPIQRGPKPDLTGAPEHRELEVLEVQDRGEGFGSPNGAQLARDAVATMRQRLGEGSAS